MDIRRVVLALLACALGQSAYADELRLDASQGAPIVEVTINGRPAQLIVDTTLPALAILGPEAARRLRVRALPVVTAQMELDGDAIVRGRIARTDVAFASGRERRTVVALLRAETEIGADGLIGPGALGYDSVRFVLHPEVQATGARTIDLRTAGRWLWSDRIGAYSIVSTIDLGQRHSLLGRSLTRRLVEDGFMLPEGGVRRVNFRLGIGVNVQALTPRTALPGAGLGELVGHTDDVLFPPAALEEDVIVVDGRSRRSPGPTLYLGRSALAACREIYYDISAGRLTLSC